MIVSPDHEIDALCKLGATHVAEVRGENGALTGYDVSPDDIDMRGYAAIADAARKARLATHATAKLAGLLAKPRQYSIAGSAVLADCTQGTVADLLALRDWGAASPAATTQWIANDGSLTQVTGAQAVALSSAVSAYRVGLYGALGLVLDGIAAGAISTNGQIDEAFA